MTPDTTPLWMALLGLVLLTALALLAAKLASRRPVAARAAAERHELHRRLRHSRLERMLRRMHVPPDTYLRRTHPAEVREQLDTCAGCGHAAKCDRALACKRNVDEDLSFCPNHDTIAALKRVA